MASPHLEWPFAHDKILRDMAARGCTSSEIAIELRRTRNAVIGRASRLKIVWRGRAGSPRHKKPKKPKLKFGKKTILSVGGNAKKRIFFEDRSPKTIKIRADGKSLLTASSTDCRWPIDGRGLDNIPRCCGAKCEGSYCEEHKIRAYMPKKNDGHSISR